MPKTAFNAQISAEQSFTVPENVTAVFTAFTLGFTAPKLCIDNVQVASIRSDDQQGYGLFYAGEGSVITSTGTAIGISGYLDSALLE